LEVKNIGIKNLIKKLNPYKLIKIVKLMASIEEIASDIGLVAVGALACAGAAYFGNGIVQDIKNILPQDISASVVIKDVAYAFAATILGAGGMYLSGQGISSVISDIKNKD
jgi:hypothetical protein